ncbi:hypothetical protein DSCO28_33490 [Desulfosarcina ovata subsp. sediminis]|uniref:Sulfotransferase domain-containing protein n=2 Tax=Desulfosarcina ovata TaxID=83564 RepID=A0A5K7ZRT9_9BACT|nr:hypothetical protein DSCO28_33490 [Desulfosarcina ovata subsp. sediminis]
MNAEVYRKLSENDPRRNISDRHTVFSFDEYKQLFRDVKNESAIGEASATYLYYYKTAISNIKKYLGDVKIIIALRNPTDRAYSAYSHLRRENAETRSFEDFLDQEPLRKQENWDILNLPVSSGLFYNQVKAYMAHFSDVKVILTNDIKNNSKSAMKKLFTFLRVDPDFVPDMTRKHNQSRRYKEGIVPAILHHNNIVKIFIRHMIEKWFSSAMQSRIRKKVDDLRTQKMRHRTRAQLDELFHDDINKLETLLERDLSDLKSY